MKDRKIQNVPHNPAQRKVPQPPGNVNPRRVINKDKGKHGKGVEEERPAKKKHEEVLNEQRNPVQRKVTPQPPGLLCKHVGKRGERDIHDCNGKHECKLISGYKRFECDKCREAGFTSRHRCKHCSFELHKVCLNPKPEITFDLFPKSTFKIVRKRGRPKNCDACGKEIHGHFYSCEKNDFDLHPACSELPGKLRISRTDFVLCKNFEYECFWCKKNKPRWFAKTEIAGLCYVSKRDKFSCHVRCLPLVMEEAWKRVGPDSDRDNDSISKVLGKVDLKPVANAKGSGGLFVEAVTIVLEIIIGVLLGDPSGLLVFAFTEFLKVLWTLS